MKFDTYLFDFDGTLVDSMPSFSSTMLRILDEHNIKYENDIIKIITPLGYAGVAKYYHNELGLALSEDEILALAKRYIYDEYAYRIQAKSNVISALKALKAHGASLNILTASPHLLIDVCLERLGMTDLFSNIWSSDDFGTTKADPEIYKMAAGRLGKAIGEVLFCDDNLDAVRTAVSAGIKVCGVYDKSSEDYADEIKSAADYYINDFTELL